MRAGWLFGWRRMSAAQWFVRLRSGPITPRVDHKFRRWLAASPTNEVDFERHELAWELAAELADDGEINALVEDAQRSAAMPKRPRPAQRQILSWSAVAVCLIAVTVGAALFIQWPLSSETYVAGVGEQRTIELPDQSRMILNTASRARVVFKRNVRVVELEYGEATFTVTHDARRPFEVRAAQGVARVLGTQFNVLSASQAVTVSVLSGKVEVVAPEIAHTDSEAAGRTVVLTKGQEVLYNRTGLSSVQSAHAARIEAWHSGRVAFEDVDLDHALAEFNRYTKTPIVIKDSALNTVRVTGVFRVGESDALLQALNTAFGIRAERRGNTIQLYSAGSAAVTTATMGPSSVSPP